MRISIRLTCRVIASGMAFAVVCGSVFAARTTEPVGVTLVDLTDDLENRAGISGNDNLKNTNGANAFDVIGDVPTSTGWTNDGRCGGSNLPLWVTYQFVRPQVVNAYRIYNQVGQDGGGHDPEARSPKEFYLEGSQTGADGSWVVLDSENETAAWAARESRYFEFANTTAYTHYRLRMVSNHGNAYIIIQQLELFSRSIEGLLVTGEPVAYGQPTPDYGLSTPAKGEEVSLSVASPIILEENRQLAVCTGWTFSVSEGGESVTKDEGDESAALVTYPGGMCKWEWHFAVSNRVQAAIQGSGTVTIPNEGWVLKGEQVTVSAVPEAGSRFLCWTGDTDGLSDVESATIVLTMDAPRTLTAVFVPEKAKNVVYVSPVGDDENGGYTADEPKKTVAAAIDSLQTVFGALGGTVRVAPGTYTTVSPLYLTNAIAVVGTTGNPRDAVIRNLYGADEETKTRTVFILNHENALVAGLTVENGQSYGNGGNIAINENGGMVSNCVLRSGVVRSYFGKGGGVYLDSAKAVVTHCRIEDSALGWQSGDESDGIAAYLKRGLLANSLIVGNAGEKIYQYPSAKEKSLVRNLQGSLVNCTIVDNCHTGLTAAVRTSADQARVVNCVIAGTKTTDGVATNSWRGLAACFINCVTDDIEAINDTCTTGTVDEMFANYAAGNYRPKMGGLLMDKGVTAGLSLPSVDFEGLPRVVGKTIDIGCYESQKTIGFRLIIR